MLTFQARWDQLVAAYHYPAVEPRRGMGHWDYVLREGHWMAEDFMQVIPKRIETVVRFTFQYDKMLFTRR
jgi:hypothetical protein